MAAARGADDFFAGWGSEVERAFPELYFDWHPKADALFVEIHSWYGTSSHVRAGYPLDLNRVYDGAREHMEEDADRDRIADRLVATTRSGYHPGLSSHMPYILRWLVLAQDAAVTFGDHPGVSPVVRSPSIALVHIQSRSLKVWADGAAVLHYDQSLSDSAAPRESQGLDLGALTLRDFQALWLPPLSFPATAHITAALGDVPAASSEAAALRLLRDYDAGAWLQHHRFIESVLQPRDGGHMDWSAANRLSTMHTEATLQDRAVLAVACHLSDHVTPVVSLPEALHYVGTARAAVLGALNELLGQHPDPHTGWPTDCSACS